MPSKSPVIRLLSDLVSIPSINPSLAPSNSNLTGEEGIATLLADQAGKLGIEIQRQAVLPGRKNILLRLKPKGKIKSRIMLAPHMDVVPAEENAFKPKLKMVNYMAEEHAIRKVQWLPSFRRFVIWRKTAPYR